MKIKPEIRQKRLDEMVYLINLITEDNDNIKEQLYTALKTIDDEKLKAKIFEIFGKGFETEISTILSEAKSAGFRENKELLELDELLYSGDGKTLEDRIDAIMDIDVKNILARFTRLCLILDTESYNLISQVIKKKFDVEYVEIIGGDGCDHSICEEYADGEIHKLEGMELPPYHPNCLCYPVFYDKGDIMREL